MESTYYTLADIVQMTQLSDRTIRTYLREGRLKGTKVSEKWMFSEEDLKNFFNDKYIKQGIVIKNDSLLDEFINKRKKANASLCVVYDFPVLTDSEAKEFCDRVMLLLSSENAVIDNMSYHYDEQKQMVRLILIGSMETVTNLLQKCSAIL